MREIDIRARRKHILQRYHRTFVFQERDEQSTVQFQEREDCGEHRVHGKGDLSFFLKTVMSQIFLINRK